MTEIEHLIGRLESQEGQWQHKLYLLKRFRDMSPVVWSDAAKSFVEVIADNRYQEALFIRHSIILWLNSTDKIPKNGWGIVADQIFCKDRSNIYNSLKRGYNLKGDGYFDRVKNLVWDVLDTRVARECENQNPHDVEMVFDLRPLKQFAKYNKTQGRKPIFI